MGLVTLLVFPVPTFLTLYYAEGISPMEVLDTDHLGIIEVGYGIEFGFVYALLSILLLKSRVFDGLPVNVEQVVRSMNLSVWDSLFLSFCAGFGEEILFRSGFQHYFHPLLVSIIFIAIHGYFHPTNWKLSLYGIILLPFIILLSYGFIEFGLWFAIAAHFMYDFVIFMSIREPKSTHS